jgi:hypothetical protein
MWNSKPEGEVYKLSISQAHYYCRKAECSAVRNMEGYATILENAGIEVTDVHATWLEAKSNQAEIWTALSGLSW